MFAFLAALALTAPCQQPARPDDIYRFPDRKTTSEACDCCRRVKDRLQAQRDALLKMGVLATEEDRREDDDLLCAWNAVNDAWDCWDDAALAWEAFDRGNMGQCTQRLEQLRHKIGEEAFQRAAMPPPIPAWVMWGKRR